MKKRVAVFGCGWSNEYLMVVNEAFRQFAATHNVDLFYFINYSSIGSDNSEKIREANIYKLPDMSWFDGAVILANTFHIDEEFETVLSSIKDTNLPAVCLGYRIDGISCFECNNYNGMYELAEHLVSHHGVQNVLYIGGPVDNQESLLRQKALTDVLDKYGYALKPENILCGNWNYFDTQYIVEDWYKANDGRLPDAIVCANDVMAMGSYVGLSKCGVTDFSNVIVTGFDDLISSRMFPPSITSVNPGWHEMAEQALDHLWKCMEGDTEIIYRVVSSHSSIRQSCGCHPDSITSLQSGSEIFLGYERMAGGSYLSGHVCELSDAFSDIRRREDIPKFFEHVLNTNHSFEGDEFYLCFVDNFFESLEREEKLENSGYPKKMELIGGIRDNKVVPPEIFETRNLLPNYNPDKDASDQYVFVCLSSQKECFGYITIVNKVNMIFDFSLFIYALHMGQNIERLRQNLKLEELNQRLSLLSVTDALTGVYNRSGCEKFAFPLIEQSHQSGKNAVMLFMDINKMKQINDNFGHEQGDVAIRLTSMSIRLAIPEEWVAVRYGGDEFLVTGTCESEEEVKNITTHIHTILSQLVKERQLPYPVTIEIGAVYIRPEDDLDPYHFLRLADAKMYHLKKYR